MYGAFWNIPSPRRGIESCIPARFFYTGDLPDTTATFIGTDRFDKKVESYSTFKTHINKSYSPTDPKTPGEAGKTSSYDWNTLSTALDAIGLLNAMAFDDVSSEYLTGDEYVYIPGQLEEYSGKCPLVTKISTEAGIIQTITDGA